MGRDWTSSGSPSRPSPSLSICRAKCERDTSTLPAARARVTSESAIRLELELRARSRSHVPLSRLNFFICVAPQQRQDAQPVPAAEQAHCVEGGWGGSAHGGGALRRRADAPRARISAVMYLRERRPVSRAAARPASPERAPLRSAGAAAVTGCQAPPGAPSLHPDPLPRPASLPRPPPTPTAPEAQPRAPPAHRLQAALRCASPQRTPQHPSPLPPPTPPAETPRPTHRPPCAAPQAASASPARTASTGSLSPASPSPSSPSARLKHLFRPSVRRSRTHRLTASPHPPSAPGRRPQLVLAPVQRGFALRPLHGVGRPRRLPRGGARRRRLQPRGELHGVLPLWVRAGGCGPDAPLPRTPPRAALSPLVAPRGARSWRAHEPPHRPVRLCVR